MRMARRMLQLLQLMPLLLLLMAEGTCAWGTVGHQVVAEIAQMHLTRRAFHELKPLLEMLDQGDHLFPQFFPEGYTHMREGDTLSLSDISVAADHYKRHVEPKARKYRVGEQRLNAFEATAALHFVNRLGGSEELDFDLACPRHMEKLCNSQDPEAPFGVWPCCGHCVTSAIVFFKELLFEPANREQASIALLFLVHLVADVHQPLHAGFADDRGGNEVLVFDPDTGQCVSLHQAWDSTILETFLRSHGLSPIAYAEDLYRSMSAGSLKPSKVAFEPRKWAREADHVLVHHHAKDAEELSGQQEGFDSGIRGGLHYSEHVGDIYWRLRYEGQAVCPKRSLLAPIIGEAYQEWAMNEINQRLFFAGVRLGTMLNDMFDGDIFWRLPWPTKDIPPRKDHKHKKPRKYRHDEL